MLLLLAAAALTCQADPARHQLPAMGRDAAAFTPKGWMQESVNRPDLDGDGAPDLVVIARHPEWEGRRLVAALATPKGLRKVGEAALPDHPLDDASVTFKNRVLIVEDLSGGTTANSYTLRYRYEGGAMRLIGVDLTRYSRTNAHDSVTLSYNWLNGRRMVRRDRLLPAGDYQPGPAKWTNGVAKCLVMEDTEDPEAILERELGG